MNAPALATVLMLAAGQAAGWEARVGRICTLSHDAPQGRMHLTYDPAVPQYAITVTRTDGDWIPAPVFSIAFDGPRGLTISTTRHRVAGAEVTVTDSGFGNVLDGLEFNTTATAILGDQTVQVSLTGAAPEVRAFRACTTSPSA